MIIDTEHGNIADDEMHISVGVVASQGVSPIVRIPAPENWIVKRTLDTGGKWTVTQGSRAVLRFHSKRMRYSAQ